MTATVTALAAYRTSPGRLLHLVRCTAALDRQAFTRLYDALKPAVTATVGELADDPARADAITAATFVMVWQTAIRNTAAGTDVTAWVTGIAVDLTAEPASTAKPGAALTAFAEPPASRRPRRDSAAATVNGRSARAAAQRRSGSRRRPPVQA
jgi:DNA-directed RNA polymerase specialized sigma24 family protein